MGKLPKRQEIREELKWRLEDIYATNQDWEQDLEKAKASREKVESLRGTIKSGKSLLTALQVHDELGVLLGHLISYAQMRKDEDNANSLYQGYAAQATAAAVELSAAGAFLEPEILDLEQEVVRGWIKEVPGLAVYEHYLENLFRMKEHTLPAEQEELLAAAGEIAEAPGNIFRMFNNADLKFPNVENDAGEMVELTHGRYIKLLESKKREVRKGAFEAMYNTYGSWKNTLGTTYLAAVKKELYFSKVRKYDSSLEMALDVDNVPPEVYTNLIDSIHSHLHLLHRYVRLRTKLLGLDQLHMYDLYVPMVQDQHLEIPREEAIAMVQEGLQPLGAEYLKDLNRSFQDGWIDWTESRGKTSGAYSWGTYGVHPYVLLNYQETLDNVFTLAQELGHALHTYYSNKSQEFINSQYTIFVAEVASTLNEAILIDHLLKKTEDPQRRAYLLNHYLEQFRGTVFRQTMFAEFEMIIHEQVSRGLPITSEQLSQIYYQLNQKYFGEDLVVDEQIALEWARIPHFYRPFYVYKYATGFSAAISLAQQILEEGETAVKRYLTFLSSGGSDYPLNLLRQAGVDMNKPEPIVRAMGVFAQLLDELEELSESKL
ncbi:MAG: oligoendopeptidase F [Firmicutes bacterium]|nr:oligoendopeptidase F [Bacillota bacterium]